MTANTNVQTWQQQLFHFMKTPLNLFVGLIMMFVIPRLQAQPVITQQPTNQIIVVGNTAIFSVSVSGTGPFTYQWQFNGTNLPSGIITTVAGNRGLGSTNLGDGGFATNAWLDYATGVAVDANGILFIADRDNHRIRRVSTNGIITTVAGGGTNYLNSGEGGFATNVMLRDASTVKVDSSGNLLIADGGNNRVCKVDKNGILTRVAGKGALGGFNFSGDGGPAVNAGMQPVDVAVDAYGNLFIADLSNQRIRKVDTSGIVTTIAGNGTSGFSGDGGDARNAELNFAQYVAVDQVGNVLIADTFNQRIRRVDTNGIITTVAGNGTADFSGDGGRATNAALYYPSGIAVDTNGNLFIADEYNSRIRRVAANGIITTVAGNGTAGFSGDGGSAILASLNYADDETIDANGNLFIADINNYCIRKVTNPSYLPTWTLNNVSSNNVGNYSVIITNSSGSVTSSVAGLAVVLSGYNQISGNLLSNGKMSLSYVGIAGGKYALDRSFSVSPPNWIPQVTNPADANGNLIFTNTPVPTTNNFWRIRSVP